MICIGMLAFIDLRMLGYAMPTVSASTIADRLNTPMMIGFAIMFSTGLLLYYAKPIYTNQSIWFRIKMILLVVAFFNAIRFHRHMKASVSTWGHEPRAPLNLRISAMLSLGLWAGVIITGRLIAYDWFHCYRELPAWLGAAAGCVAD
jgi:multisubunit Na+/H+ antiporter MnhF subunit